MHHRPHPSHGCHHHDLQIHSRKLPCGNSYKELIKVAEAAEEREEWRLAADKYLEAMLSAHPSKNELTRLHENVTKWCGQNSRR